MKILFIFGILNILYFICIEFFAGHGSNFYFIFLIMGIVLIVLAFLLHRGLVFPYLPVWLKRTGAVCISLGFLLFFIVEGFIFSGFFAKGQEGLSYLIVLGAQVRESGPGKVLRMRLDEAVEYLNENEETLVIVSGGQGVNEPYSEAQGMHDYLVEKGIPKDRIIKEAQSTNTNENINFSGALLDREKDSVGIVTNNFHVFRATSIARKNGFLEVHGISAPSDPFMYINNMFREFFGVVKDFAFGNM